jgi:hypothetical protein
MVNQALSFEGLATCEHGIEKYWDSLIDYSLISFPSPLSQSLESLNNRPAGARKTQPA